MIPIFLRGFVPRLVLVALAGAMFYLLEPGFHLHEHDAVSEADTLALGPLGISATLANLAGLGVLILLAGFISADRRRGYYRMYFSHPTRPLVFYGLRWLLGVLLAVAAAAVFLVVGQLLAWGEFQGGWSGLLLALLAAVAYGGLIAFLSATLPFGDAWVAIGLFFFGFFWLEAGNLGLLEPLPLALRQGLSLLLPPQLAMQDVYDGLLRGEVVWGGVGFTLGYGLFWLALAALLLRLREWP